MSETDQLLDYSRILKETSDRNNHLVYLTKYYEDKELNEDFVTFHQVRWIDIFSLIDNTQYQISRELKQYLKEQNMSESNNFNYQDLSTIHTVTATLSKMNEVLDGIKPAFEKRIGKFSKDSSRSTRLSEERYINYHPVIKDAVLQISIEAGFYWGHGDIEIGLRIFIPNKPKNKDANLIKEFVSKHLPDWEYDDSYTDAFQFWHSEFVAQFIIEDENQILEMINFLKSGIDDLQILKTLKLP